MSEKKELKEEELEKASGGKSIEVHTINGFPYCPNEACNKAELSEVNEGKEVDLGRRTKKTNLFEDNCGDEYALYECPVCKKRYRLYGQNKWTTH